MATLISTKKGIGVSVTILLSFAITTIALWITKKTGVAIPDEVNSTLTVLITTGLSGLYHGFQNWLRHRDDIKPLVK